MNTTTQLKVVQQIPRTSSYMCEIRCANTGKILCEGSLQMCNEYVSANKCVVLNAHIMDYVKNFPYEDIPEVMPLGGFSAF